MEMVAQRGQEFDFNGKQRGQLFFAVEDPFATVRIVLAGQRVLSTEV